MGVLKYNPSADFLELKSFSISVMSILNDVMRAIRS